MTRRPGALVLVLWVALVLVCLLVWVLAIIGAATILDR